MFITSRLHTMAVKENRDLRALAIIYARRPQSMIENVYRAGRHHDEDI